MKLKRDMHAASWLTILKLVKAIPFMHLHGCSNHIFWRDERDMLLLTGETFVKCKLGR